MKKVKNRGQSPKAKYLVIKIARLSKKDMYKTQETNPETEKEYSK
jgi:hypothetical protein